MFRSSGRLILGLVVAMAACESDSTGPALGRSEVAGTYELTTLAFDPQGSLAEVTLHDQFGGVLEPQLVLSANGDVQLFYTDPVTGLGRTVDGTFTTTSTGVRITFDQNSTFGELFFPRTLQLGFNASAGTLEFTGSAGTSVARGRLVDLVPALEDEQLLDPVPGTLRIVFTEADEENG